MKMVAKGLAFVLTEGEGYHVEFKEKIANLDREIVAFANASGGDIYLGVSDDGKIKGIEATNKFKSQINDIARNCDPTISVTIEVLQTEKIIKITIDEGTDKPYRCKEGFFLRVGPNSQKLKRDEIVNLIKHNNKVHFDEAINQQFDFEKDYAKESLQAYLTDSGIATRLSDEDVLCNLNVAKKIKGELKFTNAGILLFSKNPQSFFFESFITVVRYKSNDRLSLLDKKDFKGTLISQIQNSLQYLQQYIPVAADITSLSGASTGQRKDIYDYPIIALREAIVNAICHRDYMYDVSHTYIHMYPDRIDIENPGGLYYGLTIEDLGKRSVHRNRLIADLLYRAGYIERVGSGFDRMKYELENNNNPALEVASSNFFSLRFYKRLPVLNITDLSERQIMIMQLFEQRDVLSSNDISAALNISTDTVLRDLKQLQKSKLITKLGIGKGTRYRLVKN